MIERHVHRLRLGRELDDDGVGCRIDIEPLAVDSDARKIVPRGVDRVPFAAVAGAREDVGEVAAW